MKLPKLSLKKRDIADISENIEELSPEMTDGVVGGVVGGEKIITVGPTITWGGLTLSCNTCVCSNQCSSPQGGGTCF